MRELSHPDVLSTGVQEKMKVNGHKLVGGYRQMPCHHNNVLVSRDLFFVSDDARYESILKEQSPVGPSATRCKESELN